MIFYEDIWFWLAMANLVIGWYGWFQFNRAVNTLAKAVKIIKDLQGERQVSL